MDPEKKVVPPKKKKKKMMSIQLKHEIIEKYERGVRVVDLARLYDRNTSTICSILKQKESIKAITPAMGVKIISRLRTSAHEKMERLLLVWLTEKQLTRCPLTEGAICEKARAIYADLLRQTPGSSTGGAPEDSFKASRGWYDNFRRRISCPSDVRNFETASSDVNEDYRKTFTDVIAAEGYVPQQVFNCDETGLFWKRMPRRTFITIEEMKMPGHQPLKDRLTLTLCANASGDCKIKPLLVYHSENPRAFKSHKIIKEKLQVMWRANPRAWVTRQFFVEWVNLVFGPAVKTYLQMKNLPMRALLVLDNAPAHPHNLEDDILEDFKFIKVFYLPPDTTTILQPMDQQVVCNFKKLFTKHLFRRCFEVTQSSNLTIREFWKDHYNIVSCLRIIDMAWQGVTKRTLICAWKKLWPEVVSERVIFEPEEAVVEEIVSLGKSMGLEVDEEDVNELVEEHSEELTPEELKALQTQQHAKVLQEIGTAEEPEVDEVISTSEIMEMLGMWERLSNFIERKHPEKVATGCASSLFNDTCLAHFRNILKERKKQLLKRPAGESEESLMKKPKTEND
ncbi:tigger transposable element-derived protein 1-like [Phyllopteryx taeniolatus]|uniref:tigger transposable element-derived protein 1-like n=1 Tax=Phyllopteryx taeniolatus TaxID=161469 RepID=UPI002AD38C11|nr:tigger transposable element-derived protein 1-like [Phyllopteryx taeniolatus]